MLAPSPTNGPFLQPDRGPKGRFCLGLGPAPWIQTRAKPSERRERPGIECTGSGPQPGARGFTRAPRRPAPRRGLKASAQPAAAGGKSSEVNRPAGELAVGLAGRSQPAVRRQPGQLRAAGRRRSPRTGLMPGSSQPRRFAARAPNGPPHAPKARPRAFSPPHRQNHANPGPKAPQSLPVPASSLCACGLVKGSTIQVALACITVFAWLPLSSY
jgi:hypothetical protein